jgi:hypothetical protein
VGVESPKSSIIDFEVSEATLTALGPTTSWKSRHTLREHGIALCKFIRWDDAYTQWHLRRTEFMPEFVPVTPCEAKVSNGGWRPSKPEGAQNGTLRQHDRFPTKVVSRLPLPLAGLSIFDSVRTVIQRLVVVIAYLTQWSKLSQFTKRFFILVNSSPT